MRIKFDPIFMMPENVMQTAHIVKGLLQKITDDGYSIFSVSLYVTFKNKDNELVDCTDNIYSMYLIKEKKYKGNTTKDPVSEVKYEDDAENEAFAYIYGANSDDSGKWFGVSCDSDYYYDNGREIIFTPFEIREPKKRTRRPAKRRAR